MSIEAMKQALEALELHAKQYPHMQKGYTVDAITSLRQAIAEAEKQEPVAYVETKEVHGQMCSFIYRADSTSLLPDGSKLYTHPQPKRELIGLTNDEVEELWERTGDYGSFYLAVDDKLKEKNT